MGISSSMNAGVSGLNANASKLSTISDNIANSQTTGYKRADTDFHSIALDYSSTTYTAGGVRTTAAREIDSKGSITGTSNSMDISISGRGFLPVTTAAAVKAGEANPPFMLTSTGSFEADATGLMRTSSGLALLGWPANADGEIPEPPRNTSEGLTPIYIDRAAVAAEPTETINFKANLPASATTAGAAISSDYPITVQYFDTLGAPQTLSFTFAQVSDGNVPPAPVANTWALTINDNATNPATTVGTYDLVFDATSNNGGKISTVTQTGGTSTYDGTTGIVSLPLGNGQNIDVTIGADNAQGDAVLTQLSTIFSGASVSSSGHAAGTYAGVSIDDNGIVSIQYSTGFSRVVYKVPVADVPNINGLQSHDNQAFSITDQSGSLFLWDAGTGPVGSTQGYSLEQSTTDIGQELTDLITTQRAYSSNAKIVQTVDEMLQETTNLKR